MRVEAPKRPSLGVLPLLASIAWAATLAVEQATWLVYVEPGRLSESVLGCMLFVAVVAFACVAALGGIGLLFRTRFPRFGQLVAPCGRAVALSLAVAASFAVCAWLYWAGWEGNVLRVQEAFSEGTVTAEIIDDGSQRDYGYVSTVQVRTGDRWVTVRLLWPDDVEPLSAGSCVEVCGTLSVPADTEGGRWNHQQGYAGMVSASSVEERGYAGGLRGLVAPFRDASFERIEAYAGESAGLLAGVLIGNRTMYEDTELEKSFQTTGLAHLMAVSGTHLAVVMGILGVLFAKTPLRRGTRLAFTLCALVAYTALTCFAPSAIRACAMCAAAGCAGISRRRGHVPSALALVVLCYLGLHPSIAFSLGFVLSVLAVAGLVLFTPLVWVWICCRLPAKLEPVASVVAATIAATIPTLPVTVPVFAQLPLISPLANVLVAPLVSLTLIVGIPALLLAVPASVFGGLFLQATSCVASVASVLVGFLSQIPGACLPLDVSGPLVTFSFVVALVALYVAWPLPRAPADRLSRQLSGRKALIFTMCLTLPLFVVVACGLGRKGSETLSALDPRGSFAAEVVMLDVGQGDAMLIRDADAALLIDTGAEELLLEQSLARCGVTHLDAIVITHKDADHCGALPALTGVVGVEHVYVHEGLVGSSLVDDIESDVEWVTGGGSLEGLGVGDTVQVGRLSVEVLSPIEAGESDNEDSLVSLLVFDEDADGSPEARAFLTGDAEAQVTQDVAEEVGDVDVLKVAHHGSRKSVTQEELSVLKPQIALIGVGADNSYGHPTSQALEYLEEGGAKVYRTDLNGDIRLGFSGSTISVSVQKS